MRHPGHSGVGSTAVFGWYRSGFQAETGEVDVDTCGLWEGRRRGGGPRTCHCFHGISFVKHPTWVPFRIRSHAIANDPFPCFSFQSLCHRSFPLLRGRTDSRRERFLDSFVFIDADDLCGWVPPSNCDPSFLVLRIRWPFSRASGVERCVRTRKERCDAKERIELREAFVSEMRWERNDAWM